MHSELPPEGDRPGGAPPSPSGPPDSGPPRKGSSFKDPAKLDRAARIALNSLARRGLTYADLRAPAEHVRAA